MPNRIINSHAYGSSLALADTLASLFVLELFAPSRMIYLISPWISDFYAVDNSFGQFRVLLPEENGYVRLSTLLCALAEQGTQIYVLTRPDTSREFVTRLTTRIHHKLLPTLHKKSLITDHFYMRGSMNFTYSGLNRNDEDVEITTEPSDLAQARVAAQALWNGVSQP